MSLLREQAKGGESSREIELAKGALRFLIGGVIFAVIKSSNILLLSR